MKSILLSTIVLFSFLIVNAQTEKQLKGLEKEINAVLEATNTPSVGVAIVKGDKVIYASGFGYSDVENKVPADANTLYAIGSTSKSFTASLLGQLQSEGKLSLNDSPIDYIPELRFYNDDLNNNIIIKDLMCHRTGVPRHDASFALFHSDSKDSLISRIQFHEE